MTVIDLHFHSNYSDGKMSILELASLIKNKGRGYVALTDHDTVAGVNELAQALSDSNVAVIPGVELTALYGDNEIHILAYDFEVNAVKEALVERVRLINDQKMFEMAMSTELFRKQGLKVSENLMPNNKRPVGYTVANDICQNRDNQNLLFEKYGKNLTSDDIYFNYQAPGKPCAVKRSGVTVEWLISKLKNLVNDFVIAHPFVRVSVATNPLSETDIRNLISLGINGLEIYHNNTSSEQIQSLRNLAIEHNLSYTGGSDFHGHAGDTPVGFYETSKAITNFKITNFEQI